MYPRLLKPITTTMMTSLVTVKVQMMDLQLRNPQLLSPEKRKITNIQKVTIRIGVKLPPPSNSDNATIQNFGLKGLG